jgi:outer membrane lipopolysaccharide assembly protein LptE/RlpB
MPMLPVTKLSACDLALRSTVGFSARAYPLAIESAAHTGATTRHFETRLMVRSFRFDLPARRAPTNDKAEAGCP